MYSHHLVHSMIEAEAYHQGQAATGILLLSRHFLLENPRLLLDLAAREERGGGIVFAVLSSTVKYVLAVLR